MAYIVFSSLISFRLAGSTISKQQLFVNDTISKLKLMSFNCGNCVLAHEFPSKSNFQLFHQFHLVNFCIWCLFNRFVTESNFLASHEKEMRYFSYPSMFPFFGTRNIRSSSCRNWSTMRFIHFFLHRGQKKGFHSFAFIIGGYNVTQRKLVIYNNNDKIIRHWTTPAFWLMADN